MFGEGWYNTVDRAAASRRYSRQDFLFGVQRIGMDIAAAIREDRATRAYADTPVAKDTLVELVDLARAAGSGHNRQPWSVIILRDRDRLARLANFGEYTTPLRKSPAGIVLLIETAESAVRDRHNVFDGGRFAQNLMLAATAQGLRTCPQAFQNGAGAAEYLDVPAAKQILIGIAVGYPAETPATTIEGVPKETELHHAGRQPPTALIHWEEYSADQSE